MYTYTVMYILDLHFAPVPYINECKMQSDFGW